jgi:alkylation response protein AidB-like acyl-CoA dehydrogenase
MPYMTHQPDELRYADFSLEPEQEALFDSFGALLSRECDMDVVRGAEPLGFDADLWRTIRGAGALTMALPSRVGGDDASLVELVLVAEQCGRHLAPAPFIESVSAARLLASLQTEAADQHLAIALEEGQVITLDVLGSTNDVPRLIPAGAIAVGALSRTEAGVALASWDTPRRAVDTMGSCPISFGTIGEADVVTMLAEGSAAHDRFDRALLEWKLLTAAAMIGIGDGSVRLAADYAKERVAFGVPIGTFQAISHRVADAYNGVTALRMLTRKAAWFADHEPDRAPSLILAAFLLGTRIAQAAATTAVHVLGGVGFTLEADAQLYFRRVAGWSLAGAGRVANIRGLADSLWGPAGGQQTGAGS